MRNRYKKGEHNVIDDITGLKQKSGDMRKLQGEQKGLLTHKDNWEGLHPQLYVKSRVDKQSIKNSRPRTATNFITTKITADDL